jgi:hypothetical protein
MAGLDVLSRQRGPAFTHDLRGPLRAQRPTGRQHSG